MPFQLTKREKQTLTVLLILAGLSLLGLLCF